MKTEASVSADVLDEMYYDRDAALHSLGTGYILLSTSTVVLPLEHRDEDMQTHDGTKEGDRNEISRNIHNIKCLKTRYMQFINTGHENL
jgi:hypothetical protein